MASETFSSVARRDREDPVAARMKRDGEARLRISSPMLELLDGLSIQMNLPMAEVLIRAVGLLNVAIEAQARGEKLCLLNDDLDIVGEIADLCASKNHGSDPSPELEADRDDR